MKKLFLIFFLAALAFILFFVLGGKEVPPERQLEKIEKQIEEIRKTQEEIQEQLKKFCVVEMEVTAYAPLDPEAKEGICYSGNPKITASGAETKPGTTIAVDPKIIPYGTKVWIEGYGWKIAEDTGGAIKGNRIDLCVSSRSEAFAIGRRRAMAIWESSK